MTLSRMATRLRKPEWLSAGFMLIMSVLFMWHVLLAPPGQGLSGGDTLGLSYPWLTVARESLSAGRIPFWDPYTYSGYPFLANPQLEFFYPPAWLAFLLPVATGIALSAVIHIWLAGYGMLIFLRGMGSGWLGALLGGLIFAFSGFAGVRIAVGHLQLFATCAWTPWILAAYQRAVKSGSVWSMIVAGLPFGMALLAGHLTSLMYIGLIWTAFAIYLAVQKTPVSHVLLGLVVAVVAGLALSAIMLAPALELILHSARASEDTTAAWGSLWTLPPAQLVTLLNPVFFGGPDRVGYWGVENFGELTYYVGPLPLLAIPLATRRPTRRTWWYIGMGVIGLTLAMGVYTFLYPLTNDLMPLLHLTRAPARAAFLFVFAASALLADTITAWEAVPAEERQAQVSRIMGTALAIIFVGGMLALIATQAVYTIYSQSDTAIQLRTQSDGWAWALVVFLAGGALLWQYLSARPDRMQDRWKLAAPLAVLIVFDLWSFGFQSIQTQPLAPGSFWTETQAYVGPGIHRVMPLITDLQFELENHSELTHTYAVFGYNSLELQNYVHLTSNSTQLTSKVFDILSTEYAVTVRRLGQKWTTGDDGLTLVSDTKTARIYKRPHALPVARLVYAAEVIPDIDRAVLRIDEKDFKPDSTAILQEPPGCTLGPAPTTAGQATIEEHAPENWTIATDSPAPGLLVLSEVMYPGWHVLVDGKPAQAMNAYTVLKAVCIPSGRHEVEWVFQPTVYLVGGGITVLSLMVMILAIFKSRSAKHVECS